jgi:CubicO group peptidase (beta-lactamase class C family)
MQSAVCNLTSAIALAAILGGAQPAGDTARINDFIKAEVARQKIPGAAVAVIRGGAVVLAAGFGEANVEHHVSVTPDTIFQSGSVGKQFTATVVAWLAERGKLRFDDPLTTFFPDAPRHWRAITVRHMLTHTSGIPNYTDGSIDYRKDFSEDDLLKMAYGLKPEFEPGERWKYSNTGYVVLGIIIHKASGQFYGDLLREQIFEPLGMTTARIISEADIVPNRAAGYRLQGSALKNQNWVSPSLNTTADGALYLSLRDMIAWDAGIRERRVLKPETWTQILTPVTLNSGKPHPYGFGWSVDTINGHRIESHGGSWQGFRAHIARYPADELTVIALTNLAQANPGRITEGVAELLVPALKRSGQSAIGVLQPEIPKPVSK